MKSCKILRWFLIVIAISLLVWMGCAGSKNNGSATNEAAFYTEAKPDSLKTEKPAAKNSDEEDVLRLLGINKAKESANPESSGAEPAVAADANLENTAQQLDDEVKQKNTDLADLKSELAERDRRIASLQEQLTRTEKGGNAEPVVSGAGFKERYESGRQLYEAKKYRQAITVFTKLVEAGGEKSLMDNCQYWIGECYYGINYYNQAIVEFEKVFTYSDSDKYDDSQLKLGLCYLRIGNVEKAKNEFEKLISNYPESEYLQRAKEYLARL
jgi:tol-pal system protein YbgF